MESLEQKKGKYILVHYIQIWLGYLINTIQTLKLTLRYNILSLTQKEVFNIKMDYLFKEIIQLQLITCKG